MPTGLWRSSTAQMHVEPHALPTVLGHCPGCHKCPHCTSRLEPQVDPLPLPWYRGRRTALGPHCPCTYHSTTTCHPYRSCKYMVSKTRGHPRTMGIPDPFISNPINLCESESCIPDQTRFHRSALKPVCEKLTVMQPRVLVLLLDTLATSFSCVMQPLPPSPYPSGDPLLPHHLPTALGVSPNPARVAACYDTCTRSSFPRPAIRNGLGPSCCS